jgi:hypothetical protein
MCSSSYDAFCQLDSSFSADASLVSKISRYLKSDPHVALVLPAFFCEGSPKNFPRNKQQLLEKARTRACHQIHDDPGIDAVYLSCCSFEQI